jgi:hypothetical protein
MLPLVMGQPVKLSDNLVLDARVAAEITERSIAGQIEYWAKIGRAIEPLLRGEHALALCRAGAAKPLSECLKNVNTSEGGRKLSGYLKTLPYPHYAPVAGSPGLLLRTQANGEKAVGRFVNREFHFVKRVKK